jgi:hypothetical protein
MNWRRVVVTLGVVVALLVSIRVALAFRRFGIVERDFDSVNQGDSRSFVIARLGIPNYHVGTCSADFAPPSSCATEFVYSHPFAPFLPDYYVISFSADDRVIAAERLTSP